jgi:hypothetical protein
MKIRICKRCGQAVSFRNVTEGYFAYCWIHDEDLYEFETEMFPLTEVKEKL